MALILALHEHPEARSRLRAAVSMSAAAGARHRLRFADAWDDLHDGSSPLSDLVLVVDAYRSGRFEHSSLCSLIDACPDTPLVVYSDFRSRGASDVLAMSELGIGFCISVSVDDAPLSILRVLASALGAAAASRIMRRLSGDLPGDAVELVMSAFKMVQRLAILRGSSSAPIDTASMRAGGITSGPRSSLAVELAKSGKSLERRCTALGLPSPAKLLRWCRLFHAAPVLADPDSSLASVAEILGFSDEAALRKNVRATVGHSLSSIRGPHAVDTLVTAFLADVQSRSDPVV
jgi:AraC-like DNA-binding protein